MRSASVVAVRLHLVAGLVVLLVLPVVSAQQPTVTVALPFLADGGRIAVDPGVSNLTAPWTYSFAPGASPPAGNTTLSWSLQCGEGGVSLIGPALTPIAFQPGVQQYTGRANLSVHASPEAPGVVALNCTLAAASAAAGTALAANGSRAFNPEVAYRAELVVEVPVKLKQAGPQKMIPYAVELHNQGNARTVVHFEATSEPHGKRWNLLLPDAVVLDPGDRATAIVNVATPYKNLWNNEQGAYSVLALPSAAADSDEKGDPVNIVLMARARGWYIPGPSPLLMLAALAGAALLQRGRQD